jgi:glycosyltransferase involved in cell wall biosynthesis
MRNPKVHILFDFVDSSWGGGNQFLKSIKRYLIRNNLYSDNIHKADIVLINSHHKIFEAIKTKIKNPEMIFVHRIDGPIRYHRKDGKLLDRIIFKYNKILTSGTIFQSQFSKNESILNGINMYGQISAVITNAPDDEIFYKNNHEISSKIRLISTSWSSNLMKGFDTYEWLDKNLDFDKYEMVFIGNSPIKFKNIIHIPPVSSLDLADFLRKSDIFIFASKVESCSNSLLEALHCGLPVVAFNGSSNPEIVKQGGLLFDYPEEIPGLLKDMELNYKIFQDRISVYSLSQIGEKYYNLMLDSYKRKKKIRVITALSLMFLVAHRLLLRAFIKLSSKTRV